MVILLYHSNMLSQEQLSQIPRSTLHSWKKFQHEDYYGFEMVKDYVADFNDIKQVFQRKYLHRSLKFVCLMSNGYQDVIKHVEKKNWVLREHAKSVTSSIQRLKNYSKITTKDACRLIGVSTDWYYRHRPIKTCFKSSISKCYTQYPSQLTLEEVSIIEKTVTKPENKGKTKVTLFYSLLRKGVLSCGLATFCKYARLFGHTSSKKEKINDHKIGFLATRPFEWLHIDITDVLSVEDGKQKVAFVKDNYSMALLHVKTIPRKADSNFIAKLMQETFELYNLFDATLPINILSDGGPENKGELLTWVATIKAPPCVKKITAKTDEFPYSNSMSERTHSIYKTEFMKGKISQNISQHEKSLQDFMQEYNYERFPVRLLGYSPMEVLNGKTPSRNLFKSAKEEARITRIEVNRNTHCTFHCKSAV